ncbi:MAG: ATP-binding protein [Bacteroidales bacterium]|nr:ATP-binding protein [Bacteroidales bacterium]
MHYTFDIEKGNFTNAGNASGSVKKTLKQLNVDPANIKRIVVALYEAEINAVAHAYGGTIDIDIDGEKIVMVVADQGPGIPNIELAMTEGYSTASQKVREMGFGAGMGLPNMKKNTDLLDIQTEIGVGTTITMTVFLTN